MPIKLCVFLILDPLLPGDPVLNDILAIKKPFNPNAHHDSDCRLGSLSDACIYKRCQYSGLSVTRPQPENAELVRN